MHINSLMCSLKMVCLIIYLKEL
ncbi:hypothetical protein AZZ69_002473, partial [Klebsiella pneumoniae]